MCRKQTIYRVFDIKWDTDGDEAYPPKEMIVSVPDCELAEEYISDYITDQIGYCHDGFKLEVKKSDHIPENKAWFFS